MTNFTFVIPAISPSYNSMFKIIFSRRETYLKREAVQFKELVKDFMRTKEFPGFKDRVLVENGKNYPVKLSIRILAQTQWFFKNGKIKKQDIQNMDKLICDAVCEMLEIDDSHMWKVTSEKVQSEDKNITTVDIGINV